MDKYVRGKVLGKGSFGCAVLVTSKVDGKNYVIKEVDISRMPKSEREAAEQEAKVCTVCNSCHPAACKQMDSKADTTSRCHPESQGRI